MNMVKVVFAILVFFFPLYGAGQVINTLSDKEKAHESVFLYEVKLIDEFMERFNDAPGSYIRQQCRALMGSDSMISRRQLLKSLFNKNQIWGNEVTLFIRQVTEVAKPQFLSFTDSNWYAEANCVFQEKGKKFEVPVILHISAGEAGAKWMIVGLGKSELYKSAVNNTFSKPGGAIEANDFIPTSSYGTNFVYFNRVFIPDNRWESYFEPSVLKTERAQQFITHIQQGGITFKYVKWVRYHFYGIDNWVFAVSCFKRKDTNSGWLISQLLPMDEKQKVSALHNLLNP